MHRALVLCCLLPFITVGCQSDRKPSPNGSSETKRDNDASRRPEPSDSEQATDSEPLPREIVQAWKKAGAKVGWMRHYPEGILIFETEKNPDAGVEELPAFRFPRWQAGVLPKLPPPVAPFGLFLATRRVEDAGRITDAGLKEMAGLTSLQSLALGGSLITDAGLRELTALKNLRTLYLDRTQVTDAGLKELAPLKSLQTLNLYGTKVTDAGLRELRTALPHCEIRRSSGKAEPSDPKQATAPGPPSTSALEKVETTSADLLNALGRASAVTLKLGNGPYVYRLVRDRNDQAGTASGSGFWSGPGRVTFLFYGPYHPDAKNQVYVLVLAHRSGIGSGANKMDLSIPPGIQMTKFQALDRIASLEIGQVATVCQAAVESGEDSAGDVLYRISLERPDQPVSPLPAKSDQVNHVTRVTVQVMRIDDDWPHNHPTISEFFGRKDWPSPNGTPND